MFDDQLRLESAQRYTNMEIASTHALGLAKYLIKAIALAAL